MNKFVIPSCLAILVLVLVLVVLLYTFKLNAFKSDYFTQSSKFGNVNQMMLVAPDGNLVLQNVGDIDSSINAVGTEMETDYQPKAAMTPYAKKESVDDKMAAAVGVEEDRAKIVLNAVRDMYVQKNKWLKIINRDNPNHSVHRAQGHIRYDNKVGDNDSRRWFKFVEQDP